MEEVTEQFVRPGDAEAGGLTAGFWDADEDFAVEIEVGGISEIIEGEDICDSGVVEMRCVEMGDLGVADKVHAEGEGMEPEVLDEEGEQDRPQGG
jgi:hypothetical protein